ncbi:CD1375 family protein [Senegalia massiliensis]|nr:CD1375 family protein [Senegalia massiliensis]
MTFTTDSRIAKSYVILILAGRYTIEEVPDVGNLRGIVQELLIS